MESQRESVQNEIEMAQANNDISTKGCNEHPELPVLEVPYCNQWTVSEINF